MHDDALRERARPPLLPGGSGTSSNSNARPKGGDVVAAVDDIQALLDQCDTVQRSWNAEGVARRDPSGQRLSQPDTAGVDPARQVGRVGGTPRYDPKRRQEFNVAAPAWLVVGLRRADVDIGVAEASAMEQALREASDALRALREGTRLEARPEEECEEAKQDTAALEGEICARREKEKHTEVCLPAQSPAPDESRDRFLSKLRELAGDSSGSEVVAPSPRDLVNAACRSLLSNTVPPVEAPKSCVSHASGSRVARLPMNGDPSARLPRGAPPRSARLSACERPNSVITSGGEALVETGCGPSVGEAGGGRRRSQPVGAVAAVVGSQPSETSAIEESVRVFAKGKPVAPVEPPPPSTASSCGSVAGLGGSRSSSPSASMQVRGGPRSQESRMASAEGDSHSKTPRQQVSDPRAADSQAEQDLPASDAGKSPAASDCAPAPRGHQQSERVNRSNERRGQETVSDRAGAPQTTAMMRKPDGVRAADKQATIKQPESGARKLRAASDRPPVPNVWAQSDSASRSADGGAQRLANDFAVAPLSACTSERRPCLSERWPTHASQKQNVGQSSEACSSAFEEVQRSRRLPPHRSADIRPSPTGSQSASDRSVQVGRGALSSRPPLMFSQSPHSREENVTLAAASLERQRINGVSGGREASRQLDENFYQARRWKVVGGTDKGGIIVREGRQFSSQQCPDRLAHGALIEEEERVGDRLRYSRLLGIGPDAGWVNLTLKGKTLLLPVDSSEVPAASVETAPQAQRRQPRASSEQPAGVHYVNEATAEVVGGVAAQGRTRSCDGAFLPRIGLPRSAPPPQSKRHEGDIDECRLPQIAQARMWAPQ